MAKTQRTMICVTNLEPKKVLFSQLMNELLQDFMFERMTTYLAERTIPKKLSILYKGLYTYALI